MQIFIHHRSCRFQGGDFAPIFSNARDFSKKHIHFFTSSKQNYIQTVDSDKLHMRNASKKTFSRIVKKTVWKLVRSQLIPRLITG